jgi:hypothetical protein
VVKNWILIVIAGLLLFCLAGLYALYPPASLIDAYNTPNITIF